MRDKPLDDAENGRIITRSFKTPAGATYGAFNIKYRTFDLFVVSSGKWVEEEWEHVSVSLKHRCPNWEEMCFIKNLFWGDDEVVLQFHPAKTDYVNIHPYCLHMWKHKSLVFPMPPAILV